MAIWTSAQDITDRWVGSNFPEDTELLNALIDDAELIVLSEYPRIQDRITGGSLNENLIKLVVSRMVIRYMKNPDNLSYLQQNTGPFGQGQTFGTDRDLFMTEKERQLLAPNKGGQARSISLLDGSRKQYKDYIPTLTVFGSIADEIEWFSDDVEDYNYNSQWGNS
jgi:hypothetical protein